MICLNSTSLKTSRWRNLKLTFNGIQKRINLLKYKYVSGSQDK